MKKVLIVTLLYTLTSDCSEFEPKRLGPQMLKFENASYYLRRLENWVEFLLHYRTNWDLTIHFGAFITTGRYCSFIVLI